MKTISRLSFLVRSVAIGAACLLPAITFAAPFAPDKASTPKFQKGDRWSAVGDSITHGGSYHDFVYLYYVTRFPQDRFEMTNAGISGDTAEGAIRRFDWDVMGFKPTVATIMLGMNDVRRPLYDLPESEKNTADKKASLEQYASNLRTLASKLKTAGVKVILITPSPFDQTAIFEPTAGATATPPTPAGVVGKNDALKVATERVREIGRDLDLPVVDFNGPMTALGMEKQKSDPYFSVIGRDRVHPGPVGHFVMAYLLLKAQQAPNYVARLSIDAEAKRTTLSDNCKVSDLKASDTGASFTLLENALPYPTGPAFAPALDLVPFAADLNQEPFAVTGLKPGKYTLKIDDVTVGTFDDAALATGINLASLTTSPQYQQSLAVLELDRKRHTLLGTNLRSIAYTEFFNEKKGILPGNKGDQETMDKVVALRDAQTEERRKTPFDNYIKNKPQETELRAEYTRTVDALWEAAQPKPHRFTLVRE